MIEIEIEDNSGKVLNEYENRKPELLNAFGNELYKNITNFMRDNKIVDTGRLIGSISYSTQYNDYNNPDQNGHNTENDFVKGVRENNSILYGSNVPYASFVETGTTRQRARHYIKTGTDRAVPQLEKAGEEVLKGDSK